MGSSGSAGFQACDAPVMVNAALIKSLLAVCQRYCRVIHEFAWGSTGMLALAGFSSGLREYDAEYTRDTSEESNFGCVQNPGRSSGIELSRVLIGCQSRCGVWRIFFFRPLFEWTRVDSTCSCICMIFYECRGTRTDARSPSEKQKLVVFLASSRQCRKEMSHPSWLSHTCGNRFQAEYDMGPLADEAFVAAHAASELSSASLLRPERGTPIPPKEPNIQFQVDYPESGIRNNMVEAQHQELTSSANEATGSVVACTNVETRFFRWTATELCVVHVHA